MAGNLPPDELRTLIDALSGLPQFASLRERRALVNQALGDYPSAAEVLRWQEWDGSALVVADELVRRLDGLEPVPDVAALGLLVQTVEPLVGGAQRTRLVALRRRHAWGREPIPAAAQTWHDDRTPGELIHERIIGENTLRHLSYLQQGLRAADAVVRVEVMGLGAGTGFLIAPDLMLTNNHVIADQAQATAAEITFFYQFTLDGPVQEGTAARVADQGLLYTDAELDISLVRLVQAPILDHYLPLRPAMPEKDSRVAIIQHPGGGVKKISLQNNLVCYADASLLQYYTSTQPGSSGAPVFDDAFNVVAIHRGAIANPDWQQDSAARPDPDPKRIIDLQYRNQGSSMIAVVERLRARVPELLVDVTIRD